MRKKNKNALKILRKHYIEDDPERKIELQEENELLICKPVTGIGELVVREGVVVYTGKPAGDLEDIIDKERKHRIENESVL